MDEARLSPAALEAIGKAGAVRVSPISFYEIGQKVRLGKWPEMAPLVDGLDGLLREQGGLVAALTPEIALRAAGFAWLHRDPFDRLIGATASLSGAALVSADTVFDTLAEASLQRIW